MKSYLQPANFALAGLLIVLLLSACGDSGVTLDPVTGVNPTVTLGPSTTRTATTAPATTQAASTTAAVTTAATQNTPGLDLVTTKSTIKVGEEITITGTVKQMGLPAYSLYVDGKFYASDHEAVDPKATTHPTVLFVSATRLNDQGIFVLRGLAAGKIKVNISANGEISVKSGGDTAFVFTNIASRDIEVTITA